MPGWGSEAKLGARILVGRFSPTPRVHERAASRPAGALRAPFSFVAVARSSRTGRCADRASDARAEFTNGSLRGPSFGRKRRTLQRNWQDACGRKRHQLSKNDFVSNFLSLTAPFSEGKKVGKQSCHANVVVIFRRSILTVLLEGPVFTSEVFSWSALAL